MHVEPLEKLPRSVREFLSHYAMIVLSILTALALEQVALGIEHRREGTRAREEIQLEIASNRAVVDASLQATRENAGAWSALYARTLAAVRSGESTNESRVAALRDARGLFRDALPTLKSTAWDAAISDHAVDYLPHDDLTRYSELYAFQRLFQQAMWDTLRDSAMHDLSGLSLAVAMGKAEPEQTIAALNSRLRTIEILESQMAQIGHALKQAEGAEAARTAMPAPSAAAPAPASAPSHAPAAQASR